VSLSYFKGDETRWRSNVPVWQGVRYSNLYPGLDLEIAQQNAQIEQFVVVRDAAQLKNVRLRVEGASGLSIEGDRLIVNTEVGTYALPLLKLRNAPGLPSMTPAIVNNEVAYPFVVTGPTSESPSQIIDRPDFWSTFLGGINADAGKAIAVDELDNVYMAGYTLSPDFPTTPGPFEEYHAYYDAVVSKFDPSLSTLLASAILGSTDLGVDDRATAIVAKLTLGGMTSDVYVTGRTGGRFQRQQARRHWPTMSLSWGDVFWSS
jgi:hypothetical protein